jgi:hypothetical protein
MEVLHSSPSASQLQLLHDAHAIFVDCQSALGSATLEAEVNAVLLNSSRRYRAAIASAVSAAEEAEAEYVRI